MKVNMGYLSYKKNVVPLFSVARIHINISGRAMYLRSAYLLFKIPKQFNFACSFYYNTSR